MPATGTRSGGWAAALALLALACGPSAPESEAAPEAVSAESLEGQLLEDGPHPRATLALESLGTIEIELLPEVAAETVEAFAALADSGHYDGTTFHRVIPGFVVQGGDPLTRNSDPRDDGRGGTQQPLPDGYSALPMLRGSVAMANGGRPGTATGQFFIAHEDARQLDGGYTIFGRVVAGMEVVDAVTELEIDTYGRYGPRDRPYPVDARIASLRIGMP